MNHFQTSLLYFFLISFSITYGAINCRLNSRNWCVFYNISTNNTHSFFEPSYPDRSNVELIAFNYSMIPILTSELCETFPKLRSLALDECFLNQIQDAALSSCTNLVGFDIRDNFVTEINPYLFVNNSKIRRIDFSYNKLKHIDVKMFRSTKNLEILLLINNYLFHFDVVGIPKLEKLRELYLNFNNLLDLDEKVLINRFPKLKRLGLKGNLFECQNLDSMIKVINKSDVKLETHLKHPRTRYLPYKTREINEIVCFDRDLHYKAIADEILKSRPAPCSVTSDLIKQPSKKQENSNNNTIGVQDGVPLNLSHSILITVIQLVSSGLISFCIAMLIWHAWYWNKTLTVFAGSEPSKDYAYYVTTMQFQASASGPGPSRWKRIGTSLAT